MATEVGVGYVRLIPTARGFGAAASAALGAPMRQAAQRVGEDAGRTLGRSMGDSMKSAGAVLTAAVTVPLAALGVAALQTAGSFDASMSRVQAVTGATADELAALERAARDAAKGTQFSATEAANALAELGKSGFSAAESIEGLNPVLSLATAGELELADAADIAATIMNTMGLEAADLGRVADALAVGASNSATSVGAMGESFKRSSAAAAAAGLTVEQASEAVALFAEAGFRGEDAGTGLNKVIGDLNNESSKGAEIFSGLGVELKDAEGNLRSLSAITLDAKAAGLGYNDVIEAFGQDHGPKFAAVLGLNESKINSVAGAFDDTAGAADGMAAIMADNLPGALARLRSAWEELQLVLLRDSGVSGILTDLIDRVAAFVAAAAGFAQAHPQITAVILALGAVVAAAGPLLWIGGQLAGSLTSIAAAAPLVARGVGAVGSALAFVVSPVGLVVAGLAALAAGLVWAWNNSDAFRSALEPLAGAAGKVADAFREGGLAGAVREIGRLFREAGPEVVQGLSGLLQDVVGSLAAAGPDFITGLLAMRAALFEGALRLFEALVQALPVIIPQVIEAVVAMIRQVITALTTALPLLVAGAVTLLTGLVDAVVVVLPLVVDGVIGILTAVLQALVEALPLLLEAGVALLLSLLDGILEALPLLIEFVTGDLIPTLLETIITLLPLVIEAGIELLLALIDGLIEALPLLIETVAEMIPQVVDTLVALLPQIIDAGIEILIALIIGLARALPQLIQAVVRLIPTIVRTVVRLLPLIISAGIQILGALIRGLIRAVPLLLRAVVLDVIPAIVRGLAGAGARLVSIGWDLMRSLARGIRDGATNLVKGAAQWVTSKLTSWKGPRAVDLRLLTPAGHWIMTGLERGITDSIPSLRRTLQGVSAEIPATVNGAAALPPAALYSGAGSGAAARPAVEIVAGDRHLRAWLEHMIRTQYGGDVTRLGRA